MRKLLMSLGLVLWLAVLLQAGEQDVWKDGKPAAELVCPQLAGPMASIVEKTINGYLTDKYGLSLPLVKQINHSGLYIVVGDKTNNPVLADLVKLGVDVRTDDLGEEGFRIATHDAGDRRFVIVTANTPAGLKYGCQELVFFRMPAMAARLSLDWPLDVTKKPQIAYRGIYILPCWAPHDSIDTWRKVLQFDSEITVNRNWFWLTGFPLIREHGGKYPGTDLADVKNVAGLVDLCREEGMKFYIGGGWFTWHHIQCHCGSKQNSIERGVQYYLDMAKLLPAPKACSWSLPARAMKPKTPFEKSAPRLWKAWPRRFGRRDPISSSLSPLETPTPRIIARRCTRLTRSGYTGGGVGAIRYRKKSWRSIR